MRRADKYRLIVIAGVTALLIWALVAGGASDANGWITGGFVCMAIAAVPLALLVRTRIRRMWPLLLLPTCIAIQLLPWPAHSIAPALTWMQLARVILYVLVFASLREVTRGTRWEWKLLAIPLALACVEAVYGVAQHVRRGEDNYAIGTFGYHSHFAGFMELLLPVAILLAIHSRQIAAFVLPMILFAALLHSFSRMGLAAFAIAVVAMVTIRTRRPGIVAAAAATVLVAGVLLAPTGLAERFERISTYDGFRHDAQLTRWRNTLPLIAAHPLLGSGARTYGVALADHDPNGDDHADNDYLQILAEMGVVGTLAVFVPLGVILWRCIQTGQHNLAALACAGSMVALLAHSVFEFQMYIPANVLTLCWIAGTGCGVCDRRRSEAST